MVSVKALRFHNVKGADLRMKVLLSGPGAKTYLEYNASAGGASEEK